jgi:hypothetical protein
MSSVVEPGQARAIPPLGAVIGYALRAGFPLRRRVGLLLPASGAVLFGLLAHLVDDARPEAFAAVAGVGLFGIVLPVGCLVIGDAVLGAEVRGGTLHFTWLSPVGFSTVVLGRWLAGVLVALAAVAAPCAVAAVVAGVPGAALPVALGASSGCAAYVALFVMIGSVARRAVAWSLAFVLLGERLLGAAVTATAQLFPAWVALAVFTGLGPGTGPLVREGIPQGWAAVSRLLAITAVSLAISAWRLGHLRVSGPSDE